MFTALQQMARALWEHRVERQAHLIALTRRGQPSRFGRIDSALIGMAGLAAAFILAATHATSAPSTIHAAAERQLLLIAGETWNGSTCASAELGTDSSGTPLCFASVDFGNRTGLAYFSAGRVDRVGDSLIATFIGTPNAARSSPLPAFSARPGVWSVQADVTHAFDQPDAFDRHIPQPIAQVDDSIGGARIRSLALYDSLAKTVPSTRAGHRIAFWAGTDAGGMIVRATWVGTATGPSPCPNPLYQCDVIGTSGQDGLVSIQPFPSINDAGTVAFLGQFSDGQGVLVGDGVHSSRNIAPSRRNPNVTFGPGVQINNAGHVIVLEVINATGSIPRQQIMRVWDGNSADRILQSVANSNRPSEGSPQYQTVNAHASISNHADTLGHDGVAYSAFNGDGCPGITCLQPNFAFESGFPQFRPALADDGRVITRDGATSTSPIRLFGAGGTSVSVACGNGCAHNDFAQLGQWPGITDDGGVVGFAATRTGRPAGVYASFDGRNQADLELEQSAWREPVVAPGAAGTPFTTRFDITNRSDSPGAATDVVLKISITSGLKDDVSATTDRGETCDVAVDASGSTITCDVGDLAIGAKTSVTAHGTTTTAPLIVTSSEVKSNEKDPKPDSNVVTASIHNVPLYRQSAAAWNNGPIDEYDHRIERGVAGPYTIGTWGCELSSQAMILASLGGANGPAPAELLAPLTADIRLANGLIKHNKTLAAGQTVLVLAPSVSAITLDTPVTLPAGTQLAVWNSTDADFSYTDSLRTTRWTNPVFTLSAPTSVVWHSLSGEPLNPGSLNRFYRLDTRHARRVWTSIGYESGAVNPTGPDIYSLASSITTGQHHVQYGGLQDWSASTSPDALRALLAAGNLALVRVDSVSQHLHDGHAIVAVGSIERADRPPRIVVNDPASPNTRSGDERTHLDQDAYGTPAKYRVYKVTDSDFSSMTLTLPAPMQALVTDASGRRTGFDSATGTLLAEIPGSSAYHEDDIDDPAATALDPPRGPGANWIVFTNPPLSTYQVSVPSTADDQEFVVTTRGRDGTGKFVVLDRDVSGPSFAVGYDPSSGSGQTDKVPPATTATISPAPNSNGWSNAPSTIVLTATDAGGGSGVQSIAYLMDGAVSTPLTIVRGNSASVQVAAEGSTAVTFYATDVAGNDEAASLVAVKLDETAPQLSFGTPSPPPNAAGWNRTDVTIPCAATDALSGVSSIAPGCPVVVGTEGSAVSVTVTAIDTAGNAATFRSPVVRIDKTAPQITEIQASGVTTTSATISWTTSEPADTQLDYGPSMNYGTTTPRMTELATHHTVQLTGLKSDTTYHVRVRSADIADNETSAPDFVFETTVTTSARSLAFDGSTGFGEVAGSPDLNIKGDWTIETWFKDEDPNGFNHDYVTLLNKGDRQTSPESPYVVSLGFKRILVGIRTGWRDYTVGFSLAPGTVDPHIWHHLAATFESNSRTVIVYLDGKVMARGQIAASSNGNDLAVQIGRNGAGAGKYFHGKLDDVRIWDAVRSAEDIATDRSTELSGPQPHLIANWHFDDGSGSTAADSSGNHHDARLSSGATFSADVHD